MENNANAFMESSLKRRLIHSYENICDPGDCRGFEGSLGFDGFSEFITLSFSTQKFLKKRGKFFIDVFLFQKMINEFIVCCLS